MDKEELNKWNKIARGKGWNTCPYVLGGPSCRMCHTECIGFGYTQYIWESPKGGYYHRNCAIIRLEKEAGRNK